MKKNIILSLVISTFVVFFVNLSINPSISWISFNDFALYFYANITSTSAISMDILTFSQIFLVVLVEISLISVAFYYLTRRFFAQ